MSSLSRRACYKCGNVGHYAEVCSSSERLCYNCKQPGHESNGCPHPRTTESKLTMVAPQFWYMTDVHTAKQCYHCQGLGHVQADCPTLRLSGGATGGRCYSCGQPGHLARNCPTPGSAPPARGGGSVGRGGYGGGGIRGGFTGGNRAATCYKCGGPNHYARDCQAQAMKCYACGKLVRKQLWKILILSLTTSGPYLSRLHCTKWWPTQFGRESLLQVWHSWAHLSRLHFQRNQRDCHRYGHCTSDSGGYYNAKRSGGCCHYSDCRLRSSTTSRPRLSIAFSYFPSPLCN